MPTLAGSYNVNSTTSNTTALTSPSFTPATGEILVLKAATETSGFALGTPTATGGSITWTKRVENATGSNVYGVIWTGTVTSGGSAITVSIPGNASPSWHSMTLERWSNAQLATTPVTVNVSGTGAPSTTITTTGVNSVVSYLDGDWSAQSGSATYTNSATQDGIHQQATVYGAYYAYQTAATAGSQTFGMSAPTGQTWTLMAIEVQAPSAQITHRGTTMNTTAGNKTVVATPAVGDLIVVIAASTGVATTAISDTASGTYVQVDSTRTGFSTTGNLNAWVRTTAISSATSTTWTATQTSSTGGGLTVYSVSGMSLYGASAVRSSGGQSTGTAATTPAPVLSLTPLSGNPIITGFGNATGTTTNVVQRTGYTEAFDNGYATPTTGYETAYRISGETSATLTYGGTSSSNFATIALELAYETAPNAPTLSSPADTATVATATPQLQWSGTDPNGDNISYEVQVDTASTYDTQAATTIDSYNSGTNSNLAINSATRLGGGQSFTGNGGTLGSLQLNLSKTGSPTGNAVAKIYAHSGTFGTSSVPTGAALATSATLDVSTLTTSAVLTSLLFTGTNQITLTNGTKYVVTIEYSGGDASNTLNVVYDNSTVSAPGNLVSENTSSVWSALSTVDLKFSVNTAATPAYDKLSASDTGFTDITNSADTDPFASGDTIGYTTTSLSDGTYYWRVRGKDPSGTNTYGSWSSTRSFTVSTGGGGSPANTGQFFAFF